MKAAQRFDVSDRALAELDLLFADPSISWDRFDREYRALADRHGWSWLGDGEVARRRSLALFRSVCSYRHAEARHRQLTGEGYAFWVFRAGGCGKHADLDGLVLPPEHSFWRRCYPPLDGECSCYVVGARSIRGAERLGGDPARSPPAHWREIRDLRWTPPVDLAALLQAAIEDD